MFKVILFCLVFVASSSVARRYEPLKPDIEGTPRRNTRPAECKFGNSLHELGSSWNPDLGAPFGVMYCTRCECVPVIKRRRVIARAQCRSIKDECPKPDCEEPVQMAGTCCKVCPQQSHRDDQFLQDVPAIVPGDFESNTIGYFSALLTARTSMILKREEIKAKYTIENPLNIVATARFTVENRNLYFSFYTSNKADRPMAIQFIDEVGYILEEVILVQAKRGPVSIYQNITGKVCGVWHRIPSDYRRLLDDGKMNVLLLWGGKYQESLTLAGRILKYSNLENEEFSALVEPPGRRSGRLMNGAGGTAIISTNEKSIEFTLTFNGLFTIADKTNVSLNVRLETKDTILLRDTVIIEKPAHDYNTVELSIQRTDKLYEQLVRGKVIIVIESRRRPKVLRLKGPIMTRATCEMFETLLISADGSEEGSAWMYFNRDGSLIYNFLSPKVQSMRLIDTNSSEIVVHLSPADTSIDFLELSAFQSMNAQQLSLNVTLSEGNITMAGRLIKRYVVDARDSKQPFLLHSNKEFNVTANGMAWMAVDNECTLHYGVVISGISPYETLQLQIEEKPIDVPNAPISIITLEKFNGDRHDGFAIEMAAQDLMKIDSNVCHLLIKSNNEIWMRGRVVRPKIPRHCLLFDGDNNVPLLSDDPEAGIISIATKCFHSGQFYDESQQWRNAEEKCSMCSCVEGSARCEPIKCPILNCPTANIVQPHDDECCPVCAMNDTIATKEKRVCEFGGQFYSAGSSWHPYLPPNGFDTCTVCTCNAKTLAIQCPRIQCPPLNCSESQAYRPDPKACCRVCSNIIELTPMETIETTTKIGKNGTKTTTTTKIISSKATKKTKTSVKKQMDAADAGDEEKTNTNDEILQHGGCNVGNAIYANEEEWHPVVSALGEQQCVMCKCKVSFSSFRVDRNKIPETSAIITFYLIFRYFCYFFFFNFRIPK